MGYLGDRQEFPLAVADKLNRSDIERLLEGGVAALCIKNFVSVEMCLRLAEMVNSPRFERYDPGQYVSEAYRFGPTLNEHRADGRITDDYWGKASEARAFLMGGAPEVRVHEWFSASVRKVLGLPVSAASVRGRELYWGIIREISKGTLVHWDDIELEFPNGIFGDRLKAQLAFNAFVSVPALGGVVTIWDQRWLELDESHRLGFGYSQDVIRVESSVSIKPELGDAIIFDPRNYHSVGAGAGGRRVSFSTFLGIRGNDILLWS